MALLFKEPIQKAYRASVMSFSYFFCAILFLVAVFLPFFLAFSSYGFWKKWDLYEEQPRVLYRKEILILAYSETKGTLAYSSLDSLNQVYFDQSWPMTVVSSTLDKNFDNKPDLYEFNITIPGVTKEVKNLKVLVNFDYRIEERVRMDMVTFAYADVDLPAGGGSIYLDGELKLQQKRTVKPGSLTRTVYNYTLLDSEGSSDVFLPMTLAKYNDRNETTVYEYGKALVFPGGGSSLEVHMKVRVPANQMIMYKPPFIEVLKFAWVQYLAFLLPLGLLIFEFAKFVFGNKILESSVAVEK